VAGFSVEFSMLNPAGFYLYSLYNMQGLVNSQIGETGQIDINDVFFGIHAFCLSSLQFTQIFMYDRGKQKQVNWLIVLFLLIEFGSVVALFIVESNSPLKID
jgi:hypothetical protein